MYKLFRLLILFAMLYVYVKQNRIYAKKEERGHYPWCHEILCDFKKTDLLIREDNTVKLYKDSKQYRKDKKIDTLEEENKRLREQNGTLKTLADREIKSRLRKKDEEEVTDFDRQKYFSIYGK